MAATGQVVWLVVAALALAMVLGRGSDAGPGDDAEAALRARMVETQVAARGVRDPAVLAAMREVPRHLFVEPRLRDEAYEDRALPIPDGQTISQPYIVALMTEQLHVAPSHRILEVGTGSGYQAAVLSRLARKVYSIEIVPGLAASSAERLRELGYANVTVKQGDGYQGWPEHAPFDGIIVTAAPDHVPRPLLDQLAPNGNLVIPVGRFFQELRVFHRDGAGHIEERVVAAVRFVPMTGEAERR